MKRGRLLRKFVATGSGAWVLVVKMHYFFKVVLMPGRHAAFEYVVKLIILRGEARDTYLFHKTSPMVYRVNMHQIFKNLFILPSI